MFTAYLAHAHGMERTEYELRSYGLGPCETGLRGPVLSQPGHVKSRQEVLDIGQGSKLWTRGVFLCVGQT